MERAAVKRGLKDYPGIGNGKADQAIVFVAPRFILMK